MGVDTHLYISSDWELDEIKIVIEKYLGFKVKVESNHKIRFGYYTFYLTSKKGKVNRMMSIFTNDRTPIGSVTCLKLGFDKEAVEIMTKIAQVIGGFLEAEDSKGDIERIDGMFNPESGLTYFYKYAVINKEVKDDKDLKGLNKSIRKWQKRIYENRPSYGDEVETFKEE